MHERKPPTKDSLSGSSSQWLTNLRMALQDVDRKPVHQMICDFIRLSLKLKTLPIHYFSSLLYKKGTKNLSDYLDKKEMHRIQEIICDTGAVAILGNKMNFHQYYAMHGIRLPHLLGYNFYESGYSSNKGRWVSHNINDSDTARQYLTYLLSMSNHKSIFIKPMMDSCGYNTRRVKIASEPSLRQSEDVQHFLLTGSFLIQDEVLQHKELSDFNDTSLNTIRMDTFKADGKRPEILSAFLRIGMFGSHIDNIQAGGIFVPIDTKNGRLKAHGYNKLAKGAKIYSTHPDSQIAFFGFQIPFFDEVKQLALDAASLMPQAIIGWDIAVSHEGPILMEANARYYDMQVSDIAYGGYRNNPVFQKVEALANALSKNVKGSR